MPEKGKKQTGLRKAVNWLKYTGKIDKDEDLAVMFDLAKNTISTYLNGKPGEKFLRDFEKRFNLKVESFEQSSKPVLSTVSNLVSEPDFSKDELIKSLQETVESQKKIIAFFEYQLKQYMPEGGKDLFELNETSIKKS